MARKFGIERAHEHDRPFHEAGDFLEQGFVFHQFQPAREGEIARVGQDDLLAAVGVEHDERLRSAAS